MFPADFAYARARSLDEALDLVDEAARGRRGGQAHRRRPVAAPHDEAPPRRAPGPHRHRRPQGAQDEAGWSPVQPHHRRAHHLPAARPPAFRHPRRDARPRQRGAGPAPAASRPSRTPSRSSPTPRSAPGARSAARWPTATRRRTSRRSCSPSTRRSTSPPARAGTSISPARASEFLDRSGRAGARNPTWAAQTMLLDDFLQGIYTPTSPKTRSSPTSGSAPEAPGPAPTRSSRTRRATCPWRGSARSSRLRDGLIDGAEVPSPESPPAPTGPARQKASSRAHYPTADALAAAAAQVARVPGGTERQPPRRPARQRPVPRAPGRGPHPPRPGQGDRPRARAGAAMTARRAGAVSLIGQPLTRREDPALLTGRGRYVDDFTPPGTLHAFVVRSPLAHARITGVDVTEARAAAGRRRRLHRGRPGRPGRRPAPRRRGPAAGRAEPGAPGARQRQGAVGGPAGRPGRRRHAGARRRRRRARGHRLRRPARGHRRRWTPRPATRRCCTRTRRATSPSASASPPATPAAAFQQAAYTVSQRMTSQRLAPVAMEPRGVLAYPADGRPARSPPPHPARPRLTELAREDPRHPPGPRSTS